jgi:hypothetical protein
MLLVDVFYFRQVTVIWVTLRQGEPGALGLEPALLFRTSRLAPEQPLGLRAKSWSRAKRLYKAGH